MRHCQTTLAILAALSASLAFSEDFKTNDGKEYKNATVKRVEPDGIIVKTNSGISKLYFTELLLVEIPGIAICLAEWRNMVLRRFQDGFLGHVHKYLGFLITDPVDMLR